MKKVYTLFAGLTLVLGASAQSTSIAQKNVKLHEVASFPERHYSNTFTSNGKAQAVSSSFRIDYDQAENNTYTPNYKKFIWNMNMHISADSALKYCIVAFDSIHDYVNGIGYPQNNIQFLTVDTIFALIGQENNSGIADTLVVRILSVDNNGYPTSTALWSDTVIIPANAPIKSGANWNNSTTVYWQPNLLISTTVKKFAVKLEYYGNKLDTCGFLAGYADQGACGTGATSATTTGFSAIKTPTNTTFYANSITHKTKWGLDFPTSTGGFVYYDCNTNGSFDTGVDGVDYIQNINLWTSVTIDHNVGIKESEFVNGIKLGQNIPNPFNGITLINYEIENASNISLAVYDITGKKVMEVQEGRKSSGKHNIKLDASKLSRGVYYYSLATEQNSLTKKMVIIE